MKKGIRILLQIILLVGILIFVYFTVVLIINSVHNYSPENTRLKVIKDRSLTDTLPESTYSVISWNIGYGGLSKDADFFYDGGKMTYPAKENYQATFSGILDQVQAFDSINFLLLQEVDSSSKRSYHTDQFSQIGNKIHHHGTFIKNYSVPFIPIPLIKPLSGIESGLATFSTYNPYMAEQFVFSGSFSWPMKLFMPDRCFLSNKFLLKSGKYLYIINTHNSAFDNGSLRQQQLNQLRNYMIDCYEQGDFVIAGGDWNVNPPAYQNTPFLSGDAPVAIPFTPKADFQNWTIAFDPQYPTNRDVSDKYHPYETGTTIIDFYICSPNIKVLKVQTLYDGFTLSDHHPVYMQFELVK